jgi:hexosaminidase
MKLILCAALALLTLTNCAEKNRSFNSSEIAILPKPASLDLHEASFAFNDGQSIFSNREEQQTAAKDLEIFINKTSGFKLNVGENTESSIYFEKKEGLSPEAYELLVTPEKITISANDAAGYFYGVQTLRQLLSIETSKDTKKTKYLIPSVTIKDNPRFKWRAYMLDEARYFHGEEFVKQMLDQMALLKMNIFHWHLIDDGGWRIEIKKYPLLTEVGAFRADSEIGTWKSGKTSGKATSISFRS